MQLRIIKVCVPKKEIRGVYFATHFYNYYQSAPIDRITDYLEELTLWGCNSIAVWFDMHHFSSLSDRGAKELICRIHHIAKSAKEIGLKVLLGMLSNEYYYGETKELLAENETDGTGYFRKLCGFYNTELCPSKPKARELLIKSHMDVIEKFSDTGLDYIWLWPYDQGGCTCEKCRPWGYKGFTDLSLELSKIIKGVLPGVKCVISTWRFDAFTNGEWDGFIKRLDDVAESFEYIIADIRAKNIPKRFYSEAEKRGLKLLEFPEISMLSATPWGGYGGIPVPTLLSNEYAAAEKYHSGGFMYSEGIFEDINKAVMLGLYSGISARETVEDYFRFYFTEKAVGFAWKFTCYLESTLPRKRFGADGVADDYPREDYIDELPTFKLLSPENVQCAFALSEEIKSVIPKKASESDRFRMLYLRTVIDKSLYESGGEITRETEKAAAELEKIYYAAHADYAVSPITEKAIRENRGHI